MATSQKKLKQKAMRSYFSPKKIIEFKRLKNNILFKLFGIVIQPVVSYGCQVWLPEIVCQIHDRTNATQCFAKHSQRSTRRAPCLTFLKWTLGVNRKTSNAVVWGNCGNTPSPWNAESKYFATTESRVLGGGFHAPTDAYQA